MKLQKFMKSFIAAALLCLMIVFPATSNAANPVEQKEAAAGQASSSKPIITFDGVKNYLIQHKKLPPNFITKAQAKKLGWKPGGDLSKVAPGKSIGGDVFKNLEGRLPNKPGRVWYEADIDYTKGKRGAKRIVYANDGNQKVTLIYKTEDHYKTFQKLYGN